MNALWPVLFVLWGVMLSVYTVNTKLIRWHNVHHASYVRMPDVHIPAHVVYEMQFVVFVATGLIIFVLLLWVVGLTTPSATMMDVLPVNGSILYDDLTGARRIQWIVDIPNKTSCIVHDPYSYGDVAVAQRTLAMRPIQTVAFDSRGCFGYPCLSTTEFAGCVDMLWWVDTLLVFVCVLPMVFVVGMHICMHCNLTVWLQKYGNFPSSKM